MPEEKDLMSQVGETFNIPDQPQPSQDGDEGDSDQQVEQQPQEQEQEQPQQQGSERAETGSDRHQPRERAERGEKEQLFPDKPRKGPRGELLDRNGNVIATTRREKQLAYNLNRAQYAANQANRSHRQAVQALQQYQALDQQIKQSGLSLQQTSEALQLRALAEKDPILAVRDIVARVLSTGVTMEELFGTDAVPQINARVITNELDRRLGPLERQSRQRDQQAQTEERAQVLMEEFVHTHPYADMHGVEISNLVSQHGITPQKAYYELRSWAERRGLDFSSPLEPQVRAAMQRRGGRQRSTPGGMRGAGAATTQPAGNSRGDFRTNAPWKDIASAVFAELNSK